MYRCDLRYSSSRMDKLSGRSSQMGMRNPPSFIRTPSRRYQRRIVEGAADSKFLMMIISRGEVGREVMSVEKKIKHQMN